uniref:Uncharacterized protein n=1 Tax=Phage sp. ctGns7 TaxID=2828003 RepID=A0A8S5S951_9VIRU|nr:MAG TPA: hypothetical protein [Phage sp. ctGns7]
MIDDETLLNIAITETYKRFAMRGSSKSLVTPTLYALKLYSWLKTENQLNKYNFNLPKERIAMNLRRNSFDRL